MSDDKKSPRAPKNLPRVDVIERSTQTDWDTMLADIIAKREQNPFGVSSRPIDLQDPNMGVHWINKDKYPDAIPQAKEKGWRPVRLEEIKDVDQLGEYGTSVDGYVVRGERGNEVLMKMPKEYIERVAMAKAHENNKRIGNPYAQRAEAIEAFGRHNPDAADMVAAGDFQPTGVVRSNLERIAVTPEKTD